MDEDIIYISKGDFSSLSNYDNELKYQINHYNNKNGICEK